MDFCNLTFGVSPCTATGVKCYNTFPTTKDAPNYDKGTKDYKYINEGLPLSVINSYYGVKPYIKSSNDLPTEIKETDTVVKRLKIQLYDEEDNDVGVDPYRASRTSIAGTYWKKWLARNPNYKGRIVERYEGFEGMLEADFQLKFAGTIDNISINKGVVTIEAVDLMKKLGEIEYPLDRGISLYTALGKVHIVTDEAAMLASGAEYLDFAERQDFEVFASLTSTQVNDGSGTLSDGVKYNFIVVAYNADDRPFKWASTSETMGSGNDAVDLSWSSDSDASFYRAYLWNDSTKLIEGYAKRIHPTTTYRMLGSGLTPGKLHTKAERYFRLDDIGPVVLANWTEIHTALSIDIDSQTDLDEPGYVIINKEIISYDNITLRINLPDNITFFRLEGIKRRLFDTKSERYDIYTSVKGLLKFDAGNPFTHLKTLLDKAGISSIYIDTKFTTYESDWTDINFSTRVIIKKTKLNKIYFQLVNAVDCMSWVGEDGKIKILKHTEDPAAFAAITDAANIIYNSARVDLNEESRRTRWLFYWNRYDLEKGIEDEEAYNRANLVLDATAESADEYNDKIEDLQFCTFLNDDIDTVADINTWIDSTLLISRRTRTRDAQTLFFCDVELKDNDMATGDVIKLSTKELQDKDGIDSNNVQFRMIKKEPRGNKISLKLKRRFT